MVLVLLSQECYALVKQPNFLPNTSFGSLGYQGKEWERTFLLSWASWIDFYYKLDELFIQHNDVCSCMRNWMTISEAHSMQQESHCLPSCAYRCTQGYTHQPVGSSAEDRRLIRSSDQKPRSQRGSGGREALCVILQTDPYTTTGKF